MPDAIASNFFSGLACSLQNLLCRHVKENAMANNLTEQSAEKNVLDLLREDHEKLRQLFLAFTHLPVDEEDEDSKRDLVALACAELAIHAQLEEELFYPALRDVLEEQHLLDEAKVEHDLAKQLIAELEAIAADQELYDAKFTVLSEYVGHHMEQEEKEIFPKAQRSALDLEAMATTLLKRRKELQAELGLPAEGASQAAPQIIRSDKASISTPPFTE
jgi:hemerythrin superfamily protein